MFIARRPARKRTIMKLYATGKEKEGRGYHH